MKKLAVTALSLFLVLSSSQASTSVVKRDSVFQKHSVLKIRTQTKSVLVRAVPRAQRRLLVANNLSDGDDGPPGPDELDRHRSYRRPEVFKEHNNDRDLSDYVKTRLLLARMLAMKKYYEKWG